MSAPNNQPPAYQQSPGYTPQQGYPQPGYGQSSNVVVVTQPGTNTVVVGGCSNCGGHLSENFTVLGIILAICFFPIGVLCCFLLMEKRCDRCGATF